jgi:RHS repeat-associated protein
VSGQERDRTESEELHLAYDVLGNRTDLRRGEVETRYRYDAASQLIDSQTYDRRTEYRYDTSGRLIEEHDGERRRLIHYNGFGQPVTVTRLLPGLREHARAAFNGNALVASLVLANENEEGEEERSASVRYRWSAFDQIPQILSQRAEPDLDDVEHDRPGRLDADFAYGYGRTFATWEHGAASFHTDAFGSAIRTEETEAWVQAGRYDTFGAPEDGRGDEPEGTHEPGRLHPPELPRFGYRGELARGPRVYLRARTYNTRLGRFTTPDPLSRLARPVAAVSPYSYAGNDPLNSIDPTGLFSLGSVFSSVAHAVAHVVHGAQHVVRAITGTVTRAADVVAGSVAHAFDAVHKVLDNVAAIARKDAAQAFHAVENVAAHVVHVVRDAVSRSVGVVRSTVTSAVSWVKKHNQIIGKIGGVLSNISGGLALAGLVIAPIPGLDALTPVLEGAAVATSLAALATQGIAKAAGDRNITYGDLVNDALGAIPGGGDAEDAAEGVNAVSHVTEDASDSAKLLRKGAAGAGGRGGRLAMTHDVVANTAAKFGVDLSGVKVVINKARRGYFGATGPDGTVTLTRDAFEDEEQLARTLAHERFHVGQLRSGMGYPVTYDAGNAWESAAQQFEDSWWNNHPLNPAN